MRSLTALLLLACLTPLAAHAAKPVTSVPELDVSRYAGQCHGFLHVAR